MRPDPAFADLDLQAYVGLLELRLCEFNRPEESRQLAAMDLFDRTPLRWLPANEWLRAFHDGLLPDARLRLRRAAAELIGRVRPDTFPLQALIELIGLVGDVGAHEAVPAMLGLVADGGAWSAASPGPLPHVLAALKQLRPGGEAYGDVCRLLASPAFPDHLSFDAFEILLRARPDAWADAWLMLREKLARLQRAAPGASEGSAGVEWFERRTRDLAQRCMASLSPWTLRQGIDRLNAVLSHDLFHALDVQQPLGVLWRELLASPDSPFERRPAQAALLPPDTAGRWGRTDEADIDSGNAAWLMLCRRSDPHDCGVSWPEHWDDWYVQLDLLLQPAAQRDRQVRIEAIARQAPASWFGPFTALASWQVVQLYGEAA